MKSSVIGLAVSAFFGGVLVTLGVTNALKRDECQHQIDNTPEIVWNDDIESFPSEGELIRVEMHDSDVIYIGPAE